MHLHGKKKKTASDDLVPALKKEHLLPADGPLDVLGGAAGALDLQGDLRQPARQRLLELGVPHQRLLGVVHRAGRRALGGHAVVQARPGEGLEVLAVGIRPSDQAAGLRRDVVLSDLLYLCVTES